MKKPQSKHKKATKKELNDRILTIEQLIVKGYSYPEIFHFTAENYNISERQTRDYIAKVYGAMQKVYDEKHAHYKKLIVERFENVYKKAEQNNNYTACVQALNGMAKILGLSVDKIEATIKQSYSEWVEEQKKGNKVYIDGGNWG